MREGYMRVTPSAAGYGMPARLGVIASFQEASTPQWSVHRKLGCRSVAEENQNLAETARHFLNRKAVDAGTLLLTVPDGRIFSIAPRTPEYLGVPPLSHDKGSRSGLYATDVAIPWLPGQEFRARFTGGDVEIAAAFRLPAPLVVAWPGCEAPLPAPCATYDVRAPCMKELAPMTPRCPPLDRSRDVIVSWPARAGIVDVGLEKDSRRGLANRCHFDARAGRGVVPHDFIPPQGDLELYVGAREIITVSEGGTTLDLVVETTPEARVYPAR